MTDRWEKMEWGEKIDFVVGDLTLAIGKGDFRSCVGKWITFINNEAYERGKKEGAKKQ